MSFPKYEVYKDSGVEWLGEVPEHWSVTRLKHCLSEPLTYGANEAPSEPNSDHPRYIRITDLDVDGKLREDSYKSLSPEQAAPYMLEDGDVLLARSGATVGKSFLYSEDMGLCCYAGYLIRARARKNILSPRYLWMCTLSSYYREFIVGSSVQATIQNVSAEKYNSFWLALSHKDEQSQITRFLDHETARIDALIAEQERLIALLKEKRQAVISHAVTKGCDPSVPMKDSGVEWIGKIPEHWKMLMVKQTAESKYKSFTDGDWIESPAITEEGVRLIQTGNVGIGKYKEKGFRYISEETFNSAKCTEILPGDVLVCRLDGPVGRACLVPKLESRMITSVDNAILKPSRHFDPRFIVYVMSSNLWLEWIQAICRVGGGFRFRISRSQLGDLRLPAPPIEEQKAIADTLDAHFSKMDRLEDEAYLTISILQERRSALISAAVTGKIDVRNWQPPTSTSFTPALEAVHS